MSRSRIARPLRGDGKQPPAKRPTWEDPPEAPAVVARCRGRRVLAVMPDGALWARGQSDRYTIRRSAALAGPEPLSPVWCPVHGSDHQLSREALARVLAAAAPGRVVTVDIGRLC